MKQSIIIAIIVIVVLGAGAFVWFTLPRGVVETPPVELDEEPELPTTATFASTTLGYSITYPSDYALNNAYEYPFSSTKTIPSVQFTISSALATGTNLSADSYISIEQLPNARNCTGDIYIIENVTRHEITDGGVAYSVASSTTAAAGNRYEEWVWALKDSSPCTALRYYIHTTSIENYPEGTVREFDRAAVMSEFDGIRKSLRKL